MSHGISQLLRERQGQSSVEYAIVLLAFLASIAALGALISFGRAGRLLERSANSSSHALGATGVGGLQDILLY